MSYIYSSIPNLLVIYLSHIWMSHVTHMNASCHTHAWVMLHIWSSNPNSLVIYQSHIWTSHVAHMNERAYEWITSRTWMRHVTHMVFNSQLTGDLSISHMNESCRIYEWARIWMNIATHVNASRHTHGLQIPTQWWSMYLAYESVICIYEWVTSHTWMRHVTHVGFNFQLTGEVSTSNIIDRYHWAMSLVIFFLTYHPRASNLF